ncbi:MAG: hypothetical protein GF411_06365 [Candidatus Lokiarchaeota archaeon]|nr:hypothetical protein [Candidatus Lokiarchaeota archaeon]
MAIGDTGVEQFRDAVLQFRNQLIVAGLQPLFLFRNEVVNSEDLADRGGLDDPSRDHFLQHLLNCDRWRRRVTHNPDNQDLGTQIAEAIDPTGTIVNASNPFGGDDIQMGSTGLLVLPWDLSGADPDIPINSQLDISGIGMLLVGSIDQAIVCWTRLNSRERAGGITRHDSMRVYGWYQRIYAFLTEFAGDENRVDVAQVKAIDEPRGPENSPNRRGEGPGVNATPHGPGTSNQQT